TWKTDASRGGLYANQQSLAESPLPFQLRSLHWYVKGTLFSIRETLGNSLANGTDPFLYAKNGEVFRWYQRRLADAMRAEVSTISEEQIIGEGLISDELSFLEALSLDDLTRIRESGGFDELRASLGLTRKEFRLKSREGINHAVSAFTAHFKQVLDEF